MMTTIPVVVIKTSQVSSVVNGVQVKMGLPPACKTTPRVRLAELQENQVSACSGAMKLCKLQPPSVTSTL